MSHGIKTVIYPVKDMARAKLQFGTLLGVEPYSDQPYYVGFKVGDPISVWIRMATKRE